MELLALEDLRLNIRGYGGEVTPILEGISLEISSGEVVCLVGESGSGKTFTLLSILRLIEEDLHPQYSGKILFKGVDLLGRSEKEMLEVRRHKFGAVFQDPMTSLDPVMRIGRQLREAQWSRASRTLPSLRRVKGDDDLIEEVLKAVGLLEPKRIIRQYPHELSGGMRQRVCIGMALLNHPELLLADEPTTALDVTVQAGIVELLRDLQKQRQISVLLITHDIGLARSIANRIAVMYAGRIVEDAPVEALFVSPMHPYTRGLISCIPPITGPRPAKLTSIAGSIPLAGSHGVGCAFAPRCSFASQRCRTASPSIREVAGHRVACWNIDEVGRAALESNSQAVAGEG